MMIDHQVQRFSELVDRVDVLEKKLDAILDAVDKKFGIVVVFRNENETAEILT